MAFVTFNYNLSLNARHGRRPRVQPRRWSCSATGDEEAAYAVRLDARVVDQLPYPGETATVILGGSQLRELAAQSQRNEPPRALLYMPARNAVRAGALLAVTSARHGESGVEVDASAMCRARPAGGGSHYARAHDWVVWTYDARMALADAMVRASALAHEVRGMRERLGEEATEVWGRLRAMAADDLDRQLLEGEWAATPNVLRETYSRRAEMFSFSAVRYACASRALPHAALAEVWDCTCTLDRVLRAHELLASARAEAAAKLSLQNVLDA